MKFKIVVVFLLVSTFQISVAGNYILKVGEESHELSLDEDTKIQIDGKYFPVRLEQKKVLTYKTDNFSFDYPREYSPSRTDLGGGILQTAMGSMGSGSMQTAMGSMGSGSMGSESLILRVT